MSTSEKRVAGRVVRTRRVVGLLLATLSPVAGVVPTRPAVALAAAQAPVSQAPAAARRGPAPAAVLAAGEISVDHRPAPGAATASIRGRLADAPAVAPDRVQVEGSDLGRAGTVAGEPVVLHFAASDTGALAACGATAGAGTPALRDLRFFIHDIGLGDAQGVERALVIVDDGAWQVGGVALVDLEDGRGACREGTPEVRSVVLTRAAPGRGLEGQASPRPAGTQRAGRTLRFRIGVPFELNHTDPARAHGALALTSMHWSWRAGYKFLRLSATLEGGVPWFLHLGSTGCAGTIGAVSRCRHPSRPAVVLEDFDPMRDEIRLDPQPLFAALAAAPADARIASCMGVPSAPGCAAVFPVLGLDAAGQVAAAAQLFRVVPRTAAAEIDAPAGRLRRGREAEIAASAPRPQRTSGAPPTLPRPSLGGTVPAALRPSTVVAIGSGSLPAHIPVPRIPPASAMRVELGRHLFYDRRLSADETMSCATCHQQKRAFTDGRAHGVGITGEVHPRGAMSLANVVYVSRLTWANPHLDRLEDQARLPLFGEEPVEMGMAGRELELVARLRAEPVYPRLFAQAFPGDGDPVTLEHMLEAIAAFERTLLSVDAPLDRWLAGDRAALSPAAQRGYELFLSERLECFHCHGGPLFTDALTHEGLPAAEVAFHNNGLYDIDGRGGYPQDDTGLFGVTLDPADMGRFRAPTLRNIAVTAPYRHDGSIASLDEVIDHYAAGGRAIAEGPHAGVGATSPLKSEFVAGFILTPDEEVDLLAFLHSLTDDTFLTDPRHADPWPAPSPAGG